MISLNAWSWLTLSALLAAGIGPEGDPIVRLAAGGSRDDGRPAAGARIQSLGGIAADSDGNVYFTDRERHVVRRVDAKTGLLSTVAGTGVRGESGDGGPARDAQLNSPSLLALDPSGSLYVLTWSNPRIRRIDLRRGTIETVSEDLNAESMTVAPGGDLYIVDGGIKRVAAGTRQVSRFADWSGVADKVLLGSSGGPQMVRRSLAFLAFDRRGDAYIADTTRKQISVIRAGRQDAELLATRENLEADGESSFRGEDPRGGPGPLVVDANGTVYFCEGDQGRIRALGPQPGRLRTLAGRGLGGEDPLGVGDGGPAIDAHIPNPFALALDGRGNLYVGDGRNRIRRLDLKTGRIETIAGATSRNPGGDGGPSTAATLSKPYGIAVSPSGDLFIADRETRRVRVVDGRSGIIRTLSIGEFRPGLAIGFDRLVFDHAGSLFGIDQYGGIYRIALPAGEVKKEAGKYEGPRELGPALDTSILPQGLAFDTAGHAYFSDYSRNQIVRWDLAAGRLTAVAGTGEPGFAGDGGPATDARLNDPSGIVVDTAGTIYFSDRRNRRVRRIDAASGIITTVAGNGQSGFSGDGGLAVRETLSAPGELALDQNRFLFVSDYAGSDSRIRRLDLVSGILTTVVGGGTFTARVESGLPGIETFLPSNFYGFLALAPDGTLYFSSSNDGQVFAISTRESGAR